MKKLLLLLFVAAFLFVFFKSNTWETRKVTATRNGIEYFTTEHSLHWDRFAEYVKNIPEKVKYQFQ